MKGHYFKRGKTWTYVVDIGKDHTGKRKQKFKGGFKTKKEAEKACAELITQIENEQYIEPSKIRLKDFILEFMEEHEKQTIRPTTYRTQINIIRKHIIPNLGHYELQKLTSMIIQKFYNQKAKEGYSGSYIKLMHAILCKTLRTAHEWEVVNKNVTTLVRSPRIERKEVQTWTIDEAKRFLSVVQNRRLYIAYVLAIFTGMRKGEILGLQWKDIDLETKRISVRRTLIKDDNGKLTFDDTKTFGSKRLISLSDFVVSSLKKRKAQLNEMKLRLGKGFQDFDLVVCNNVGTPLDLGDLNRDLNYVIEKYDFPKIKFHALRHTHATLLLLLGENPKVVAERLGHSSISITMDTYSHVTPTMQQQAADKLDQAINLVNTKQSL